MFPSRQNSFCVQYKAPRGFTLVEVLTTVGIIAALMAMLLPASSKIVQKAQAVKCAGNLKNFAQAAESYSLDNDNKLLPAQTLNGSTTIFWHWMLRPYLGASSEWDGSKDSKFWCPGMKKNAAFTWSWGYGSNSCPGYEGAGSTSAQKRFHWEEVNVAALQNWKGLFRKTEITDRSKRLWLSDSTEWQVTPKADGTANFAEANRHGRERCNVLFFDGHVEVLGKAATGKAVYHPGG